MSAGPSQALASLNLRAQAAQFRSPQPYATPAGAARDLNTDLLGTIFIRSQGSAADIHVGRVVSGLRFAVNF